MKKFSLIFILIIALFFVFLSSTAYAAELQVSIPGAGKNLNLPEYIKAIYNYALSIVGILATVVIMFGGLMWVMAAGNASKIDNAKSWITAGITGYVLLMMSFTLLYMINPNLTTFRALNPKVPDKPKTLEDGKGYANCGWWTTCDGRTQVSNSYCSSASKEHESQDKCCCNIINVVGDKAKTGQPCERNPDCLAGRCLDKLKLCTDGSLNSPCEYNSHCNGSNLCLGNFCLRPTH